MKQDEFTIGKGIAVAGKWIAIAIMFVSLLNFIDNNFIENKDCYYPEVRVPVEYIELNENSNISKIEINNEEIPTIKYGK